MTKEIILLLDKFVLNKHLFGYLTCLLNNVANVREVLVDLSIHLSDLSIHWGDPSIYLGNPFIHFSNPFIYMDKGSDTKGDDYRMVIRVG